MKIFYQTPLWFDFGLLFVIFGILFAALGIIGYAHFTNPGDLKLTELWHVTCWIAFPWWMVESWIRKSWVLGKDLIKEIKARWVCFKEGHDWNYWYDDVTFPTSCQRCSHIPTKREMAKFATLHIWCDKCKWIVEGEKHSEGCPFEGEEAHE